MASRHPGHISSGRGRPALLTVVLGAGLALVPWTGYLAGSLPDQHGTQQWRAAWVGFDIGLLTCFGLAAWLGWRRHRAAGPVLVATAALLCSDAWFDVLLDWSGPERWGSLLSAALLELPLAATLVLRARSLLVGGMRSRWTTVRDIDVREDPASGRLLDTLGRGVPLRAEAIAAAVGRPVPTVTARLVELARSGYVRRGRDGRWRDRPQDLRMPDPAALGATERKRFQAHLDARFDHELRVLSRAVRQRDQLGRWGRASRGNAYLTEAELGRFEEEYLDLVRRYSLLHGRPGSQLRQVALRFFAFPHSVVDEVSGADLMAQRDATQPSRASMASSAAGTESTSTSNSSARGLTKPELVERASQSTSPP